MHTRRKVQSRVQSTLPLTASVAVPEQPVAVLAVMVLVAPSASGAQQVNSVALQSSRHAGSGASVIPRVRQHVELDPQPAMGSGHEQELAVAHVSAQK
jgi:hypothetical protein